MSELLSGWELKKMERAKLVASGSSCCNSDLVYAKCPYISGLVHLLFNM
jgi:hypothetical protein